ncbi:MAG: zinc ribbon domain-containing protein [Dehalococcoidia bacterium]|nr:zinc ribbon domain-containing protein [Dehalococcoidia bacterium]MDZ4277676.1 zinc ribbon domain-containing protein [Dehalococcoidia bacterium]
MPIYEYTCEACGRLTSVFTKSMSADTEARCSHCGSAKLSRAPSRFAYHKSEQRVLEQHGSEPQRLEDYRDPRQIGRWAERKFDEYGMELPKQAREMIDAAREGELPSPVDEL